MPYGTMIVYVYNLDCVFLKFINYALYLMGATCDVVSIKSIKTVGLSTNGMMKISPSLSVG